MNDDSMRDDIAVMLFVAIILFILAMYVISALYFDGLINLIEYGIDLIYLVIEAIKTLFRAIYETFLG